MKYVSASQIEKFIRCPRRWAHTYIDGVREPGSKATEFGKAFHTAVEGYLQTGIVSAPEGTPRAARIKLLIASAIAGGHISHKGFRGECERAIRDGVFNIAGVPVVGFIDVYCAASRMPVIIDHKTTSNWAYAKSEIELKFNTQMLIYAAWALAQNKDAKSVLLKHIQYATTKRVEVRTVEVVVSREHVAKQMLRITGIVEEMKKVISSAKALRSTQDCDSFGRRCPFATNGMCKPSSPTLELVSPMAVPFSEIKRRAEQRASLNPPDAKHAPQMPARRPRNAAPAPKPQAPKQAQKRPPTVGVLRDSIVVTRSLSDGKGGFYQVQCGIASSDQIEATLALLDSKLKAVLNRG